MKKVLLWECVLIPPIFHTVWIIVRANAVLESNALDCQFIMFVGFFVFFNQSDCSCYVKTLITV